MEEGLEEERGMKNNVGSSNSTHAHIHDFFPVTVIFFVNFCLGTEVDALK